MWRSAQGTSRARAWARLAHSTLLNDFSGVEVGIAYDWSQSAVLPSPSYYILTPKPSRPCAAITQTECLQQLTTRPPASEFLLTECIKALGRSAFTAHPLCHRRCKLASNFFFDVQAGNKSALTYRCDIGVPGYTGFIPQTAAIPLQVKGSTKYIGEQPQELSHLSHLPVCE